MRTSNFAKGRLAAGFFRICLGIIVSLTLAMGGMALNTQPVQAAELLLLSLYLLLTVTECQPFTISHLRNSTTVLCGRTADMIFYWEVGDLPPWVTVDMNTGVLSGCPPRVASLPEAPITFRFGALSLYQCTPSCRLLARNCLLVSITVTITINVAPMYPSDHQLQRITRWHGRACRST